MKTCKNLPKVMIMIRERASEETIEPERLWCGAVQGWGIEKIFKTVRWELERVLLNTDELPTW